MKKNNKLPITNKHLWSEKDLPVSVFIVDSNNRAAIKEIIGLDSHWGYVDGVGDFPEPYYYTHHKRYGGDSHWSDVAMANGNHRDNLEGITLRWEHNPFNIQNG